MLKHKQDIFFFFSIQNIENNCSIIPLILYQLYLVIKGLIFVILCGSFFISSWFNATVTGYWKYLLSFLLIGSIVSFLFCIQSGEFKYDSPRFRFILWHYNNTISGHNWRQIHYLLSIQIILITCLFLSKLFLSI